METFSDKVQLVFRLAAATLLLVASLAFLGYCFIDGREQPDFAIVTASFSSAIIFGEAIALKRS